MDSKVSVRELKSFSLTMSWAIPLVFMLLLPWIFERDISFWPLYVSAVLIALYFLFPKGIYPIFRGWMFFATIIGWINTRIILAFVFYLIIFPIGILMKLFGKLQYQSIEDEHQTSYWKTKDTEQETDLKRPF